MVPSHAGGLEMTGPVGVIGFPQLSFTAGGVGITIALAQDTVALVGGIAGNGSYRCRQYVHSLVNSLAICICPCVSDVSSHAGE
jgi:hypothetical protein